MTAKIAYCAILRISFVIEYVYILLVFFFLRYRFYAYFYFYILRSVFLLGASGKLLYYIDTEIKILLFIIIIIIIIIIVVVVVVVVVIITEFTFAVHPFFEPDLVVDPCFFPREMQIKLSKFSFATIKINFC